MLCVASARLFSVRIHPRLVGTAVAPWTVKPVLLSKIVDPFREFGAVVGLLYSIDRLLSSFSPETHLYVYDLMVQPITDRPLVPVRWNKKLEIREIKGGDAELGLMPVRPEVMRARLAQNAICLGAFAKGALIGYMWFCGGSYDEDEVRCTYLMTPAQASVFDFDFYLFPEHRMGLGFVALWNGANEFLNRKGIHYTFSRLTRFNVASRRAHQRLGGRVVGRVLFLQAWRLEIMLATVFPYVSITRSGRVHLKLRPDVPSTSTSSPRHRHASSANVMHDGHPQRPTDSRSQHATRIAASGFQWTFRPVDQVADFEREWDDFNSRTLRTSLLGAAFLRKALQHFGNGNEYFAVASDSEGSAAMCLLRMRRPAVVETFQPSQLPLCPWLQRSDVDVSALARSLVRDHAGPIVLVALTQLDPWLVARPADATSLRTLPYITTGTIEIDDSLERYMADRSANLLANLRRRQRSVEHEFGSISLQVIDAAEDIEAGMTLYSNLESAGWKAKLGTAIERGNLQWRFYVDAMTALARQGQCQVFALRFGDQLAAAALAIVHNCVAYMLKTTYNEQLRTYGPGVFLRREVIAGFQRQAPPVGRIEIYGPLNAAQSQWVTATREMYHINAYRTRTVARLHSLSKVLRTSPADKDSAAKVAS